MMIVNRMYIPSERIEHTSLLGIIKIRTSVGVSLELDQQTVYAL